VEDRAQAWWCKLHPAWVGLLAFALYLPTIAYGYVEYDDPWLVRDNHLLSNPSLESIWLVLTDFSWEQRHRLGAEYLPVRDLSVMLDRAVFGDWVGGLHLTQVLLFGICCALAATLTLAMFESRALAWLTGAFFATHPVHVEAVAWLSERKGLLGAVFVFASLLCSIAYLRRGGRGRALSAWVLFLLAVAAKAVTIASAGALVLIVLWLQSPISRGGKLALVVGYTSFGLLAFIPYLWVARSFGVVASEGGADFASSLLLFFQAHTQYLELMSFAGPYAIRYEIGSNPVTWSSWLPGAVAAVAAFAFVGRAILVRSARGAVIFGLGWWLVFPAPVSHVFAAVQNAAADRYVFIPSFGLLLGLSAALVRLPRTLAWLLGAAVVVIGSAWTVIQMPVWSSSERLFENAVEVAPRNAVAWDQLALLAVEEGKPKLAWRYTERGLVHSPGDWRLLHRQGLLLASRGQLDQAIRTMSEAATTPEAHLAYANLALLYLRRGDQDDALRAAEEAVRFQPQTAHNQRVLGIVAYQRGDEALACRAFERAYALDPYDEANVRNLKRCGRDAREL
jgi:tetratricopeptide (TPR) repeat protein